MSRINRSRVAVGAAPLTTGLLAYLVARPSGSIWFVPSTLDLDIPVPSGALHAVAPLLVVTNDRIYFVQGTIDPFVFATAAATAIASSIICRTQPKGVTS